MEQTLQKPAVRVGLALLCCALWGSAFPCVKIGYEWLHIENTGSQILFAGYRFFLSGILTFGMGCILEKRILTMKKSSVFYIIRQGIFQTTVQYVCFYIAMAYTTGTKGSVINASNAFVSIIAAHFMLKSEKMTWKKTVGCVIGIMGVVIINLEPGAWGAGFTWRGEGMMVLCALSYGVSTVVSKMIAHRESAMTITAYQLLFGGAVLIVIGLAAGGNISGFEMKSVLLLTYMAALSAIAFSVWLLLLKHNPVSKVAIFGFCIPLFGVLFSAVLLGEEILSLKNIIALVCVSVGIYIVNRPGVHTLAKT